jgi:hypothetical protein
MINVIEAVAPQAGTWGSNAVIIDKILNIVIPPGCSQAKGLKILNNTGLIFPG